MPNPFDVFENLVKNCEAALTSYTKIIACQKWLICQSVGVGFALITCCCT